MGGCPELFGENILQKTSFLIHPALAALLCWVWGTPGLGGRGAEPVNSLKLACAWGFSFTLCSSRAGGIEAPVII